MTDQSGQPATEIIGALRACAGRGLWVTGGLGRVHWSLDAHEDQPDDPGLVVWTTQADDLFERAFEYRGDQPDVTYDDALAYARARAAEPEWPTREPEPYDAASEPDPF